MARPVLMLAAGVLLAATPIQSYAQRLSRTNFAAAHLTPAEPVAQAGAMKSPGTAAVLSFLLPGAGQLYNEEITKGVVMLVLTAGSVAMMIDGVDEYDCDPTEKCAPWLLPTGAGVGLAIHVWSIFDAAAGARRWNTRHAGPKRAGVGSVEMLPHGRVGVTLLSAVF